jgi:hypothetical protein
MKADVSVDDGYIRRSPNYEGIIVIFVDEKNLDEFVSL